MVMVPAPSTPPRARDASAPDEPLPSFDTSPPEPALSSSQVRVLPSTIPPPPRTGAFLRAQSARTTSESGPWASAPAWLGSGGERVRGLLPHALRERVQGYPGAKVLVVSGAVGVLFFGLFAAAGGGLYRMLRAPEPKSASVGVPAPMEEGATPAESVSHAPPAPVVAAQPPTAAADEAAVLLDLADSLLADRRDSDVPAIVARLITRQPSLKDDARVKRVLLSAAGSADRKASSEAHALLTGAMGETGASLVYELSIDRDVRDAARLRAQNWTTTKDFERVASLPVYAAAKLRNAKTCEDKHALLDFGAAVGGSYVRSYLHELEGQTSCKPDDLVHCQPCLRSDSRLSDAIAKLDRAAR